MTNNHTTDLKGAADMLKVHPKTALDLIQSGALPAGKIGRAYVLLVKDVLAYIENRIIAQTAERMRQPARRKKTDA